MALDLLARELGVDRINQAKHRALYAFCQKDGKTLLLAKPQTFMNLSGEAVRDLAQTFQVPPERIVVLYDDISLPSGRLRVRRSGSAGGHNGIKNIIYQLSSDQFPRVKIGVGAPQKGPERFCAGHGGFRCLRRDQAGPGSRPYPDLSGSGRRHAGVQRRASRPQRMSRTQNLTFFTPPFLWERGIALWRKT